jgi:hypothetical protein
VAQNLVEVGVAELDLAISANASIGSSVIAAFPSDRASPAIVLRV